MNSNALHIVETVLDQLTVPEKLELIERLARSLRVPSPARSPEQKREALNQLRQEMAALPTVPPTNAFSGRDHDRLLYGDRR